MYHVVIPQIPRGQRTMSDHTESVETGWRQPGLFPETTIRAELVMWLDADTQLIHYGWHIATGSGLEVVEITGNETTPLTDGPRALGRVVERKLTDLRNRVSPFPA